MLVGIVSNVEYGEVRDGHVRLWGSLAYVHSAIMHAQFYAFSLVVQVVWFLTAALNVLATSLPLNPDRACR